MPVLSVDELHVEIARGSARHLAVTDVAFAVEPGEALGIVGESGSGKSLSLRAIARTLPPRTHLVGGPADRSGAPVARMAMIFQEPLAAMNPTRRVGDVIADAVQVARGRGRKASHERALELLREVGVSAPERRMRMYPHELSGGLRQRVMIATALATDPEVLLCDEPTTALDVTIQDQILGLLDGLRKRHNMAIIFVTHDLAVVATLCQRLAVMYAGQLVESGPTAHVLGAPRHPYTAALLAASRSRTGSGPAIPIGGRPPDPADYAAGCRFADRCQYALPACRAASYAMTESTDGRADACIRSAELVDQLAQVRR